MIENYYEATISQVFGSRLKNGGVGVGIEIEVEGRDLPGQCLGWDAVRDGSLRGESFEYVLKGPVALPMAKERLVALKSVFTQLRSQIRDAHRGSVHIHVNVQNKTIEQVFTTLYLWQIIEPLWLTMCGPRRDGNLFCLPSYCSGDMAFFADSLLSNLRTKSFFDIRHRGKYASLNTDCIQTFGSLEFRTFPTETDPKIVGRWVDWCNNVVQKGSAIDIKDMHKVWKAAYSNPREFFLGVFDAESLRPFSDSDLSEYLERGIQASGDMLIVGEQHIKEKAIPAVPMPNAEALKKAYVDFFGEEARR